MAQLSDRWFAICSHCAHLHVSYGSALLPCDVKFFGIGKILDVSMEQRDFQNVTIYFVTTLQNLLRDSGVDFMFTGGVNQITPGSRGDEAIVGKLCLKRIIKL